MSIEEILEFIFEDMDLNILDGLVPSFECDCSRERVEKALISIGRKDLEEIYSEGKEEEIKCHFCNSNYVFTSSEIGELLKRI